MSVRVRYAPSPTGLQHIGGLRTALFNYFFAKSQGGQFLLRIEDTDQERFDQRALDDLYDTLDWLEIVCDEGPRVGGPHAPYLQSKRVSVYQDYAVKLVQSGKAYWSYEKEESRDKPYDGENRNQSAEEAAELEEAGIKPVCRLRRPDEGATVIEDLVLGSVKRKHKDLPMDPVLLKSDGFPTYHLANVVDDHLMEITHVMRAQEWIPSAPLHVLLYQALGWEPPAFCHLPMVMGKDGQKLSKRHGATAVLEFRKAGYLPEALMNYVSLLGWSYDDSREFFSKADLESLFDIKKLNKAPAVFDYKKLDWFNGSYIRDRKVSDIKAMILPYVIDEGIVSDPPSAEEDSILDGAMPLVQERLKLLSDAPGLVRFLYREPEHVDPGEAVPKRLDADTARDYLARAKALLSEIGDQDDEKLEAAFRELAEELGAKLGDILTPVRVAVTGSRVSLPLFASIRLIGQDRAQARMARLLERL